MLCSLTLHRLITGTLLLIVFLSSSGESRPHVAHEDGLGVDRGGGSRAPLLEAVKMGILGSLGMDREPTQTGGASEEELRRMFQLYEAKLREMRGNSSQKMGDTLPLSTTTVLSPATVETLPLRRRGRLHSGQLLQWRRAVFHKSPILQTELTLARAELRISRQVLDRPPSVRHEVRPEVKVKVNRTKPVNSAQWTHTDSPFAANVSRTHDAILDISPEVERWMRAGGDQALSVDVGVAAGGTDVPGADPTISLELGFGTSRRLPRSTKEDACDERGWCCRKSITVSFRDIGWSDWVVAPAEYTMHFCDGACPHNYKPASMHAQVKSRLHQITKGGTPRPCCVPAAYEPMVLMHYDSRGKLKLTPFDDFIVSRCHCA